MRFSKLHLLIGTAICAHLALLVLYGLEDFPALHGDEAWVGLYAQRLQARGLFTPHEMNTYTGPLYGWIVSKWFASSGVSVWSLRITGALVNLAAAFWMLFQLGRRWGRESAAVWLYLLSTSAIFLYSSRIAWEVCALQNILLAAIIWSCRSFLEERRFSTSAVLVFFLANYIGIWNHFIFISVPVSLFLLAFYYMVFYWDWKRLRVMPLVSMNLLMAVFVYGFKPSWSQEFWRAHSNVLLPAVLAFPLVCAGVFFLTASSAEIFFRRLAVWCREYRNVLRKLLGLSLLAFAIYHAAPMIQIWSNALIFKRIASWEPPALLTLSLYAWAAFILGACAHFAYRHLSPEAFKGLPLYDRFLVYWPFAYAAIYIAFRHTSSVRHYVIPTFLFMVSAAVVLPLVFSRLQRRRAWFVAGAVAVFLNICYWSEIVSPGVRRPIRFRIGWRMEKSADFLSKKPVYDMMERKKICKLDQDESMIDIPIFFHQNVQPHDCDYSKSVAVRYCEQCAQAPYFSWTIRPNP